MFYDFGYKPSKSQIFAQKIYQIAVNDQGLTLESISLMYLENLADEALRQFPKECDVRFRESAIEHIRTFQSVW